MCLWDFPIVWFFAFLALPNLAKTLTCSYLWWGSLVYHKLTGTQWYCEVSYCLIQPGCLERLHDISLVQLRDQICSVYQSVNEMSVCYYFSETKKPTPLLKQRMTKATSTLIHFQKPPFSFHWKRSNSFTFTRVFVSFSPVHTKTQKQVFDWWSIV